MQFAQPVWLWLLLPAALACWRVLAPRRRKAIPYARTNALPRQKFALRLLLYRAAPWLYPVGLLLLILAMARPRHNLSAFQRESRAISIMMVVDVSGSMEALDLSRQNRGEIEYLTRLDVVKEVFRDFITVRPDDLIGLVSFGGYASVLAPLTLDHEALGQILAGLEIPAPIQNSAGNVINEDERMTAVGDALALATARLREAETESRIIVLLSDGVSNAGILEPLQAAQITQELGIRVYTIGVGSTGYAPVRVRDAAGRTAIRQTFIEMDEPTLREIAERTGGLYFNTRDEEGLSRALLAINELETTPVQQQMLERYKEHYRGLLLTATLLLCTAITMHATTRQRML